MVSALHQTRVKTPNALMAGYRIHFVKVLLTTALGLYRLQLRGDELCVSTFIDACKPVLSCSFLFFSFSFSLSLSFSFSLILCTMIDRASAAESRSRSRRRRERKIFLILQEQDETHREREKNIYKDKGKRQTAT